MPCRLGWLRTVTEPLGHHRQRLHVHREGVHLHAVDLVAGEGAGQRIDADVLRLDVAGGLVELAIECGRSRPCRSCGWRRRAWHPAEQGKNVQARLDQLLERDAVVLGDGSETDVDLVLVVLGAEVERRARFGH